MSITRTDKALLGITVAIATVAAGAVRLWMAFPTFAVGVIVAVALMKILNSQQHSSRKHAVEGSDEAETDSPAGFHSFGAFGPHKDGDINPATGMRMTGMYDAGGNRWMHNRHHDIG